jgi:PHD/YefM family antitoxin component YafN of YafNO toxin-antitoxin module
MQQKPEPSCTNLLTKQANTRQPIIITGKRKNAILISEEDWNAITETL